MSTVELAVADLGRRLRGPAGVRRALLREVRDGLEDAVADYVDAGVGRGEAVRRAVDEFGRPDELVGLYQAELDACQGRRTAMLIAVSYPAMTLLWDVLWRFAPTGGPASPGIMTAARLTDAVSYGAAILAACAVPHFARTTARWSRRLALGVAGLGAVTLMVMLSTSLWMSLNNGGTGAREMQTSAAGTAVTLVSVVVSLTVAVSVALTLRRVRGTRART